MSGIANSGIFSIASRGAIGSGAGGTILSLGSGAGAGAGAGNGPTGALSSPVSPSGMVEGAATGSEKTGSVLVVLVMSSIAFCRSLSTLD